jgi:outer membrane protein assembly factor BamB
MPAPRCLSSTLGSALAFVAALAATALPAMADSTPPSPAGADWPQFRGAERSGVSAEQGLAHSWPSGGPPVTWRRSIGEGFSGIAVAGDRLFTMSSGNGKETVLAADTASGRTVWETPVDDLFVEEFGNGPRATPAVGADRVYAVSSSAKLFALDRGTGKPIWNVDLLATFGATRPMRGFAPSPLVDGDQVLLEVGGSDRRAVVAFDAATGKTRWTVPGNRGSYTSPIVATLDGIRQYVFLVGGGQELVGVGVDGGELWRFPWIGGAIAMPVFVPPNRLFASSQLDDGSILVEVRRENGKLAAHQVWQSRQMKNHFNSSLFLGDSLFGFDNASLRCLDAGSGESRWVSRGHGKGSLLAADGLLFVLGDRGELTLVDASSTGYVERGRVRAVSGKAWTPPSLARGHLYVRDQDELVSLDVSAAGSATGSSGGQP